jgi:hypothetical protein
MRIRLLLMPILLCCCVTAFSQGPGSGSGSQPLVPLAYLVGGTWSAEGELPGLGEYAVERSYRWILKGRFIEQRNVMTLPDQEFETLGIIGWDPARESIATWGFGDDGGIAVTQARSVSPDEFELQGERKAMHNAGPVRASFRKVGENEFLEIAQTRKKGEWVPMFTFRFTREQ